MAIETDFFIETLSVAKAWEAKTFGQTFAAAPIVVAFSTEVKKKSGVDNVTTTGYDLSCETLNARVFACTAGYSAEVTNIHPERDAGQETITVAKAFQSFSFNSTFSVAPKVIAGYYGTTAGGKKVSITNITTTGGDISNEETFDTTWVAIVPGAFP